MKGIKGEYSWPEREEADGGKVAGYHAFWRRKSESSEPHDWEPFLDVLPVQYGDDTLKAGIEKAVSDGINAELKTIPALFEYAVVHQCRPNKRVKVYLGKAMNFQASQDEMLKGDTNETKDMWKYFRLALQHNCSIVRRYCYYSAHEMKSGRDRKIDPQTLIDRAESRFLSSFDYPWNRQPGSDERGIYLTPHNALCCIPRGVDVIRIHPSMVTSS